MTISWDQFELDFDHLYFTNKFNKFIESLGVDSNKNYTIGKSLFSRMENRHLTYHNYAHVIDLLERAPNYNVTLTKVEELAIWFHDAVYIPRAKFQQNEISSAMFMRCSMEGLIDFQQIADAEKIILDTASHLVEFDAFSPVVLDLDIASFSDPRDKYKEATQRLNKEFENVGVNNFLQGRVDFLKKLSSRKTIYRSKLFIDNYEEKARENIRLDLQELKAS
jgi:predicted metal-dependent HD superfamily phosphohydrolase